jgi:potassium-transporting ATPase KdpC subunit
MLRHFRASLVMLVLMTLLLGIAYPLAMVGVAGAAFPRQAAGSLVEKDGKVVGSSLVGQSFAGEAYFHGRPSATTDTDPADPTRTIAAHYNAASSGGSNLGPTSKALIDRVKEDADKLGKGVPVDLVTTSGSGLDPHLSPEAAAWQVARVAKARGLPEAEVRTLVAQNTEGRMYGLLGEPRVNVLKLNLALDALAKR